MNEQGEGKIAFALHNGFIGMIIDILIYIETLEWIKRFGIVEHLGERSIVENGEQMRGTKDTVNVVEQVVYSILPHGLL